LNALSCGGFCLCPLLGAVTEAGQGGIKAALGHTGMPTVPLAQLIPGATQLQSTLQKLEDGGDVRRQLAS